MNLLEFLAALREQRQPFPSHVLRRARRHYHEQRVLAAARYAHNYSITRTRAALIYAVPVELVDAAWERLGYPRRERT
jgi:coproporphyrinogen III oxidase-like Fe-S oxidoreductase